MQKLMMILILLLIISLNVGCRGTIKLPPIVDQERCIISLEFNKCRCHMYRVSHKEIGRVGESTNKPLEYCDKLIGFKSSAWINYALWFEEVFQIVADENRKFTRPEVEGEYEILLMEMGE